MASWKEALCNGFGDWQWLSDDIAEAKEEAFDGESLFDCIEIED